MGEDSEVVTARVPKWLRDALDHEARKSHVGSGGVSGVVRRALVAYLNVSAPEEG